MYNGELIERLLSFVRERNGIADKGLLAEQLRTEFALIKDRSVYYNDWFAIRLCGAASRNFSNTVLSLSALRKYDRRPFIVCVVTPCENHLFLANSTFLKRVSHSSQELRTNNIKGSFNGSDIAKEYDGIENTAANFEYLFTSHENYTFEENLERLVEKTNGIVTKGKRFTPSKEEEVCILKSVDRSISFLQSTEYQILNEELGDRVHGVESEIVIASLIENVNIRGRIIEYLITSEGKLKETLIKCLHERKPLPKIYTADKLGDYEKDFGTYMTETDIKTKVLFLSSNPKGYNIDKLLQFLSESNSVYLIYIVAIDSDERIKTRLCSIFNKQLLSGTHIIKHWAGRNSRGVTQYRGESLEAIIDKYDATIDADEAKSFIAMLL